MKKYEEFKLDLKNERMDNETSQKVITRVTCPNVGTTLKNCNSKNCNMTVNTCRTTYK